MTQMTSWSIMEAVLLIAEDAVVFGEGVVHHAHLGFAERGGA